jgi:hypothetical protein
VASPSAVAGRWRSAVSGLTQGVVHWRPPPLHGGSRTSCSIGAT